MKYLYIFLLLTLLSSCKAKEGVRYFENFDKTKKISDKNYPPIVFKPGDLINIRVSSATNAGTEPFNLTESSYIFTDGGTSTSISHRPYLVNEDGLINFPVLGDINVANKTFDEIRSQLKEMILPYVQEPRIEIELINFKVSVIGDVRSPGVLNVENGRISILEAIAESGDLNISGKRTDIYVLREEEGSKKFIKLNLLNDSVFNSPAYYLQQNDVVYVEQGKFKTREAAWESRIPIVTSILAVFITIFTLLTR